MGKKFVLGTLFGAAVGAVAGLLYAPKKGEELREDLLDKSEDFKAVALDYVELATVKGEELKKVALEKKEELKGSLQDGVQDLKGQFAEKQDELKKHVSDLKQKVTSEK